MLDSEKTLERVESQLQECEMRSQLFGEWEQRLEECNKAQQLLENLTKLSSATEKKRFALQSRAIILLNTILDALKISESSLERAQEALRLAELSFDAVQIARAQLSLGTQYLNDGDISTAERMWVQLLLTAEEYPDNNDMQTIVGRTLIVQGHVLNGKLQYPDAIEILEDARLTLERTGDLIGAAEAIQLMASIYHNLIDADSTDCCLNIADKLRERARKQLS